MEKIKIDLKNCYGIKKLEKDFDFSRKHTYAIYAPNGVMKTSFAKTFKDLSFGQKPKDLIFSKRETTCKIIKDDFNELKKEEIFVIEPYQEDFSSKKIYTLLANKDLKSKYDSIHIKIDEEKNKLLEKLKHRYSRACNASLGILNQAVH